MVPLKAGLILNIFTDNLLLDIILLISFVLLLFTYAFLTSAKIAYSSANIIMLRNFMDEKKRGAKKAVFLAEKFDSTLTTILIASVFINAFLIAISIYIFSSIIGNQLIANLIAILVIVILLLFFGTMFPKQFAKENAEKTALRSSFLVFTIYLLNKPLTSVFLKVKKLLNRKAEKLASPKVTEDEIESIIDVMETEGLIDEANADLLQSVISLGETTVYDIMTPRVDVVAIDIDDSLDTIKSTFFEYQFSRIPVYKEDKDNIIGILSERDFFTALIKNKDINIRTLLSQPYFVSESTKVNELIREMQRRKTHFAIVSDEYGGTSGIVTMEDALEELVGEIYDEFDEVDNMELTKVDQNRYLVSPDMEVDELFDELNLGEVPETKYSTVGGFVYSLCEGLPVEGQIVHYNTVVESQDEDERYLTQFELEFTVKKVENRRIRAIELNVKKIEE